MEKKMDRETLIRAILECNFAGFKSDIIDVAVKRIMECMEDETVRHGRWEMKPDPYGFFDEIPVCSECGHTTKMRETYNYCPRCGAKMEVDEWLGE